MPHCSLLEDNYKVTILLIIFTNLMIYIAWIYFLSSLENNSKTIVYACSTYIFLIN